MFLRKSRHTPTLMNQLVAEVAAEKSSSVEMSKQLSNAQTTAQQAQKDVDGLRVEVGWLVL